MPLPDAANADLSRLVAAAADLCRKPFRHGVVVVSTPEDGDTTLRLEVRSRDGHRLPNQDLELEIFRSGDQLNLILTWWNDDTRPMLWHGSHPVWMAPEGQRCQRPEDGLPLEALARRLRALLVMG